MKLKEISEIVGYNYKWIGNIKLHQFFVEQNLQTTNYTTLVVI